MSRTRIAETQLTLMRAARLLRCSCRLALVMAVCVLPLLAQDLLVLKNGDQLRGNVKKIEYSNLQLDVAYGRNVFEINLKDVVSLETKGTKVIEVSGGDQYIGTILIVADDPDSIQIRTAKGVVRIKRTQLVALDETDNSALGRLHASADVGFSLIRAGGAKQLTIGSTSDYVGTRWVSSGSLNLVRNTQGGAMPVQRLDASAKFGALLRHGWTAAAFASFLSSAEQELDLRTSLIGGVGKNFRQTDSVEISTFGGIAWSREQFSNQMAPTVSSAEGAIVNVANFHRLGQGRFESLSTAILYPGISNRGRFRSNVTTEFRVTLPKKLYIHFRFSNSYDSAPVNNASHFDYVFTSGLGWKK